MAASRLKIFISSVQNEFQQIRRNLKSFLIGDAFLQRFVSDVFLFEDLPAKDRRSDEVYLDEVRSCDIYIGIFGYDYGSEDEKGISPTEHEYNHATKLHKTRLIYVWGSDEKNRSPKMKKLIHKASSEVIRRRIDNISALTAAVYASLVDHLECSGALHVPPFDRAVCDKAGFDDLSRKRIDWFLATAGRERNFPLKKSTTTQALLTHLNLLEQGRPTNAAMLLFGSSSQRFLRTAETKCVHCVGVEYRRPFASQQIYAGDVFDQADSALEFVLARINRSVGVRKESNVAAAAFELPRDAVGEAIINAIAHRDYHSNAAVEIRLFSDRLEVWNPGRLPGILTLDDLRHDHPSVPYNPLIAESLYLTRYIEKAGSGTQRMIELCLAAGLPEPQFEQRSGSFVITIWRDWLTDEAMIRFDLNDRQRQAIAIVKTQGRITNREYRQRTGVVIRSASRDLEDLVGKGILNKVGTTGRNTFYTLARKLATK